MPAVTNTTPLTQTRIAQESGQAAGNARHRVDVGAVIDASTRGAGSVRGDIQSSASTQAIDCVDPADMLARLAAPTVTGGAQAQSAYSIGAEVRMDIAVDMQAQAEAMARVVGDVVNNQGEVHLDCPGGGGGGAAPPFVGDDNSQPVDGALLGSTAPQRPSQSATQSAKQGS